MDFSIRKAQKADMPQVLRLIKALALYEKEPDAVVIDVATLEAMGYGEAPMFTCFVAETATGIVGMALVFPRFSTWKGKALHLEDLIVDEAYRGYGIGLALYKQVMAYAKEQNMNRVQWEVLDWNTPAIDFYETSGATVLRDWNVVQIHKEGIDNLTKQG